MGHSRSAVSLGMEASPRMDAILKENEELRKTIERQSLALDSIMSDDESS